MIELLSEDRCINCNLCVSVCPTNVFDRSRMGGAPSIARQSDCQTCFMCELYCPVDALYVTPLADQTAEVDEQDVINQQLLGSYREAVGWGKGRKSTASSDQSHIILNRK
ncbi:MULTISPECIES: 4Fe-4S dicluster domain-containing protein [Priestia]|uniref:Ferredoxin family protein n=1 Tax=Priestia aryabhattai TaxID=412384 RepID=A0AAX6N6V2_PRIAR|nr:MULTISPECIES: ferredoxin family protein [Priestia]MDU9691673.1 ferredoxin family protein [Priestia aryabhattai]MED5245559.1 ferredoxin family protein [Priestia sp. LL-8]QDZ79631.1 4Fe-4S dicluster domain-containing protein [Priestia megaterium]TPF17070.1 4Fe-4S ferredoxin [Priestia megaterium]TPF23954.1 4Fe-4S ferredoxin [Priestia megaterium]